MTEDEWLTCDDPTTMLEFLRGKISERKMRLIACAVSYRYAPLTLGGWYEAGLLTAEDYADARAETHAVTAAKSQVWSAFQELRSRHFPSPSQVNRGFFGGAVSAAQNLLRLLSEDALLDVPLNLVWYAKAAYPLPEPGLAEVPSEVGHRAIDTELSTYPVTIREVVGNPFGPVRADPAWLTSTVVTLATGIYEQRAFDRMPILADALQDAGCENEDILNHCRGGGPHVRGCWVVDLLLGKS